MRSFIATMLFALLAISASATTVTGTVTDPDGISWANGSITFSLVASSGDLFCSGVKMTPAQLKVTAALDASGSFSTTLCANSSITPVSSQWAITVIPLATTPPQNLTPTTVSGSSQSLSTYINALITAIRVPIVFGTRAYSDIEILNPPTGGQYYNLTTQTVRFWNGTVWSDTGSGGTVSPSTVTTSIRPYIDVTSPAFGATCLPPHDDTAAIQAAINSAARSSSNCGTNSNPPSNNCAGVVFLPNVVCGVTHLKMSAYVTIQGTGPNNSGLVQLAGSNQHMITGTDPLVDQRMAIRDLSLNGNKSNQVGSFDCIHFDGTGALATVRSPRNTVDNVWAQQCGQDGISMFGDAGSNYITNSHGFQNGRYGVNLDTYDSHITDGEYYSNGTAGINLGTHGNGSVTENKVWGNGTGTSGDGLRVGSGNWRVDSVDAQDNFCNGITATGNNLIMTGLLLDGNGNTGGGNGCAGLVLSAVNYSYINATFTSIVDAGTSDYAVAFVGSNNKNIIDMPISDAHPPLVSTYSGTINNNNFRGNTVNGELHNINQEFLNGINLRGFSDTGATQTWAVLSNIGQATWKTLIINAGPTMSNPPRMNFSGSSGTTFTGINTNYGGSYTPTVAITITGYDIHLDTVGVGCSTWPIVSLWDQTAAAVVANTGITMAAATVNYHIAPGTNVPAAHVITFATTTAGVGCSTNPTSPHFNVEYVVQ